MRGFVESRPMGWHGAGSIWTSRRMHAEAPRCASSKSTGQRMQLVCSGPGAAAPSAPSFCYGASQLCAVISHGRSVSANAAVCCAAMLVTSLLSDARTQ
jgi:hypothetical protein